MFKTNRKFPAVFFLPGAALLWLPLIFAAPQKQAGLNLEAKLARKADFVPSDKATLDRLVAIAKHYDIPMGIEWIGGAGAEDLEVPAAALPATCTVRDLLTAIVSRLPDYQLTVQSDVVHIAPPVIAVRNDNFLNLIIEDFEVKNDMLFGAQHYLRIAIDMTLHPKGYEGGGYGGGYGYDPGHVFAKQRFSYKSDDLTVRQILDGLAKANGNALWIAEFDREDFASQPKSNAADALKDKEESKRQWRFIPLRDQLKSN